MENRPSELFEQNDHERSILPSRSEYRKKKKKQKERNVHLILARSLFALFMLLMVSIFVYIFFISNWSSCFK